MRLLFPRAARLTHAGEFGHVRETGQKHHGKLFILSVAASKDDAEAASRVGIITSRRVGGAVERNRVRRRLRECVRLDRPVLASGRWFVLVAKAPATRAAFAVLRDEWRRLAGRAGLLDETP